MKLESIAREDVNIRKTSIKIKGMYSHLPEVFKEEPDYILLHIGGNQIAMLNQYIRWTQTDWR